MRTAEAIDADITEATTRLKALRQERTETRLAARESIVRSFDAGRQARSIAKDAGMTLPAVRQVLWWAGRTDRSRAARRQQVDAFLEGAQT